MVRIMIKGGVWKNTEDEILKAAVMKYGKNMWDRVASLLTRKSAKQCKARWHEWLDPSIRKTEWSREEEEKLLHLAKLMPTQWRTIAPIVGRTPGQCLEHYEYLLDQAQRKEEEGEDAEGMGVGASSDDPRKLKPGEIDPTPEIRPARPDFVDMDEDEKEMLNEARARLANTRGKKAKRKARERQLMDARRLGSLQKHRELRAAGIANIRRRKVKKGEIDYVEEIPFEKKPTVGVYDVSEELSAERNADKEFRVRSLLDIEGKNRTLREEDERRDDERKERKRKKEDPLAHERRVSQLNDPSATRHRSRLSLPSSQITEKELDEARAALRDGAQGSGEFVGAAATPALGATPTPMRTPARQNTVMDEAHNLIALTSQTTPLVGGANPDLRSGSGFAGATPAYGPVQTPNALTTPLKLKAMDGGGGVDSGVSISMEQHPGSVTPAFSVQGSESEMSVKMNRASARKQKKKRRDKIKGLVDSLPAPVNEYSVVLPELDDGGEAEKEMVADAADVDAAAAAERKRLDEEMRAKMPTAIRMGLPRPPLPKKGKKYGVPSALYVDEPDHRRALSRVMQEMATMVVQHAVEFPVDAHARSQKPQKRRKVDGDGDDNDPSEEELAAARTLIENEMKQVEDIDGKMKKFGDAWIDAYEGMVYVPTLKKHCELSDLTNGQAIEGLNHEIEKARAIMTADSQYASKLEGKMKIRTRGYLMKSDSLRQQIGDAYDQVDQRSIELRCFRELQKQEKAALPHRVSKLRNELEEVRALEAQHQQNYATLLSEHRELSKE